MCGDEKSAEKHDFPVWPRDVSDVRGPNVGMSDLQENRRTKNPIILDIEQCYKKINVGYLASRHDEVRYLRHQELDDAAGDVAGAGAHRFGPHVPTEKKTFKTSLT